MGRNGACVMIITWYIVTETDRCFHTPKHYIIPASSRRHQLTILCTPSGEWNVCLLFLLHPLPLSFSPSHTQSACLFVQFTFPNSVLLLCHYSAFPASVMKDKCVLKWLGLYVTCRFLSSGQQLSPSFIMKVVLCLLVLVAAAYAAPKELTDVQKRVFLDGLLDNLGLGRKKSSCS